MSRFILYLQANSPFISNKKAMFPAQGNNLNEKLNFACNIPSQDDGQMAEGDQYREW